MFRHGLDFDPSVPGSSISSSTTGTTTGRSKLAATAGKVMNTAIGLVDLDDMMKRIDVNDVFARVDWNDVIDEIDWNNLLEHVDMDAMLHRIDVNAVVERIDVNSLIERSNLKSIIARSTSGICMMGLDSFRAICIKCDQLLQRMGRCADCCFCWPDYAKWMLPPLPTVTPIKRRKDRHQDRKLRRSMACPRKSTHLAIAVQGRCAGTCSRVLGFAIDKGITTGFAFLLVLIVTQLISLVPEEKWEPEANCNSTDCEEEVAAFDLLDGHQTREERMLFAVVLPIIFVVFLGFVIDAMFLACIGRTIGKMIMGLMVVDSRHGRVRHLTVSQAIIRAALINCWPFTIIGAVLSMVRDDRRGINDLLCGTTVIYAWDAKRYRLAEEDCTKDMPFGDLESFDSPNIRRRRSSIFGGRRKRQAIHSKRGGSGSKKVETRLVTVPVFDDDIEDGFDAGRSKTRGAPRMETRVVTVPVMDELDYDA